MKDERLLKGEPIASGIVEGEILVSKDPINFYMVSPEKGTIIEQDHALTDKVIAKKIIVFPIDKAALWCRWTACIRCPSLTTNLRDSLCWI